MNGGTPDLGVLQHSAYQRRFASHRQRHGARYYGAQARRDSAIQFGKKYRLLFEKNLAGVAIASLEGKVIDCNDAWAQILGYRCAEEVRGRPTADFYYDLASQEPLIEELKRDGAFSNREMQLRRKDGTPVWVLFNTVLTLFCSHITVVHH